jgi:hypothetical protein
VSQYKTRISSDIMVEHAPYLIQQVVDIPQQQRCGEVWDILLLIGTTAGGL